MRVGVVNLHAHLVTLVCKYKLWPVLMSEDVKVTYIIHLSLISNIIARNGVSRTQ